MVTKLKNSIKGNYKLKLIFLFLTFVSISICFESCFDLRYNFLSQNQWSTIRIQSYYFLGYVKELYLRDIKDDYSYIALGSFLLSLIFYNIYRINKNTYTKSSNYILDFLKELQLEVIVFSFFIVLAIRYYEWSNTPPFFDNGLVVFDTIILFIVYILYKYILMNRKNLKSKISTYKLLKDLSYKHNKNSLKKRLVTVFILVFITLFILTFIILYLYENIVYEPIFLLIFFPLLYSAPTLYMYSTFSKKLDYIGDISESIKNIESGNLKYKLKVKGEDEISQLADSINKITDGLENAVKSQIKSEKMKTELITNVSHDLKTPLTSIVNYVDILKNNELDKSTTTTYLNILDKKTQRLKSLVEDIFEASKINSGDIELNIEKTDIKELLIQSLVELDDRIKKSNLDFIINTPDHPVFTNIDGKKTFRVFENLISNIIKYSLENTRVYLDMYTKDNFVIITMKNISNYKLNISSEELLERFRRGDVSRNTEGSGLGLSIAQSLVQLQNGSLSLDIDGDLFKVTIKFNTIS